MAKQVIAVLGGTGGQGGGVVEALLGLGQFTVRVASRNPAGDAAKALARRGVEVVKADLLDAAILRLPFEGAYGAFVVTNFWDPAQMPRETEIGAAAVKAARSFGVKHLVWSTLPDCESLTGGRLKVVHFTGKARVDPAVEAAGFPRSTFVQAPMYFQNFLTMNTPQPLPGGGRGWAVPMDPAARVMHAGDVTEVGRAVAAAFAAGDKVPNGTYLAVCGGVYILERLRRHAERARARAAGDAGAARGLRQLLSGCARAARDVSVLRAAHLLRPGAREAHRGGPCPGARWIHRVRRLGQGPHEAELSACNADEAQSRAQ